MTEKLTDDELVAESQMLEAQIDALHKDIEAMLEAERMTKEARLHIEDVATALVARQTAIGEELQKRDGGKDPEPLT